MPFNTTKTIPAGWSAHHQPAVEGAFNAKIAITDPARTTPGAWDPDEGVFGPPAPFYVAGGPDDPHTDWRGGVPCRIQRMRSDHIEEQAGQEITTRLYLIQFPHDLPVVQVGYVATVTAAVNDAHLTGQELVASDVQHGSERFARDVVWTHNQQPRQDEM